MGANCSRKAKQEEVSDGEGEHHNTQPRQPWPSPNNSNGPFSDPFLMPHKNLEMMEKGKQEPLAANTAKIPARGVKFSHQVDEYPSEAASSVEGAYPDDKDERSKEEKKRLSRMLSDKANSMRSKTSIVAKKGASRVSEVLRGAGTVGLGKAVEALDTFGSSVANLNPGRGFASGAVPKGNKIGILAFEVANTIVKGCNLKQSLSEEEMNILRDETLVSEGVQLLVSTDRTELMAIAAADKRHELKIFADEVVRFGNHCRDPRWHYLDRVFNRLVREETIPRQPKEEADSIMDELMTLAQNTAELYHELHALDRFQTDLRRKQQEEELFTGTAARGGETVALLKSEVKSQEKHVKTLKKRSLWSKILEEVMEQLVDIVYFLYQEIHDNFGPDVFMEEAENEPKRKTGKLGTSGLALHYANIINQIDSLVIRPSSVPPNTRDTLYQGLPPTMKAALRVRLQQSSKKDELSIDEIKGELYKILNWLVPVASNTTKAHHGFGWVGEWANTGSSADRKSMGYAELTLLQTLHHANQQKVEGYILELIVGLHHLVSRARNNSNNNNNNNNNNSNNGQRSPQKSPIRVAVVKKPVQKFEKFVPPERNISPPPFGMFASANFSNLQFLPQHTPAGPAASPELSQEDKDMLRNFDSGLTPRKVIPGLSKSQEFDSSRVAANRERPRLSKSSSHSPSSTNECKADPPLYKPRNPCVHPLSLDIDRLNEHDIDGADPFRCRPLTAS